jgi:hypothetical protein
MACDVRFMGHDDDGDVLLIQLLEDLHDLLSLERGDVSGRLVCHQDIRRACDRARDCNALLLSSGELRRLVVHAVLEPDL